MISLNKIAFNVSTERRTNRLLISSLVLLIPKIKTKVKLVTVIIAMIIRTNGIITIR